MDIVIKDGFIFDGTGAPRRAENTPALTVESFGA